MSPTLQTCLYKSALGDVGKGIHSYRILNIAIVDVIMTIVGAFIITTYLPSYNFYNVLIVVFMIGILFHRLFCVRTTIDKLLFSPFLL